MYRNTVYSAMFVDSSMKEDNISLLPRRMYYIIHFTYIILLVLPI